MSKQDRQGVRTASDLERKYDLGGIGNQSKQQSEKLSQFNQALAQYEARTNARLSELESKLSTYGYYPIGAIHISADTSDPSALFGGEWVLYTAGHFIVGAEQETGEELPELLQSLETCYVWKRIS